MSELIKVQALDMLAQEILKLKNKEETAGQLSDPDFMTLRRLLLVYAMIKNPDSYMHEYMSAVNLLCPDDESINLMEEFYETEI